MPREITCFLYLIVIMGVVAILAPGYGLLFWLSVTLLVVGAVYYHREVCYLRKPWAFHSVETPAPYKELRSPGSGLPIHPSYERIECHEEKLAHFWLPPWRPLVVTDTRYETAGLLTARELQELLRRYPYYQHPLAPPMCQRHKAPAPCVTCSLENARFLEAHERQILEGLQTGDYVLHRQHGIGRYVGRQRLLVNGVESDYITVEFAEGCKLHVPFDQMDQLERYFCTGEPPPNLDRLV